MKLSVFDGPSFPLNEGKGEIRTLHFNLDTVTMDERADILRKIEQAENKFYAEVGEHPTKLLLGVANYLALASAVNYYRNFKNPRPALPEEHNGMQIIVTQSNQLEVAGSMAAALVLDGRKG
ncbi:hypothetical protein [Paenibacillus xylanexedens]|uniref:hypothetical protein n=1 Tax=Paenibacillus xylanexedens TaxID=528191 RepID=UPI0011A7A195|nr:hypothetical protein [Paenibacillus xylanexedens]